MGQRQDRFWSAVEQRGERMQAGRSRRIPQWRGLQRFAGSHPLLGSIIQGFVWGLLMFVLFSVVTLFRHEMLNLIVWSLGGVFFGGAMYGYNRWRRGKGE